MGYDYTKEDYYFRIDERQNTFDSLQKTKVFLDKIDEDEFYWKWAMLALHNTLYGSMILALLGSNSARVKDERKNKKDVKSDKNFVISFWEAFKRIQKPKYMKMYVGSKFVCITPEIEKFKQGQEYKDKAGFFPPGLNSSLEHLNNYIRNQFLHYYPTLISFGKGGFIEIILDATNLIRFLLLECGNVRIDSEDERNFIDNSLSSIELSARTMDKKYKDQNV